MTKRRRPALVVSFFFAVLFAVSAIAKTASIALYPQGVYFLGFDQECTEQIDVSSAEFRCVGAPADWYPAAPDLNWPATPYVPQAISAVRIIESGIRDDIVLSECDEQPFLPFTAAVNFICFRDDVVYRNGFEGG